MDYNDVVIMILMIIIVGLGFILFKNNNGLMNTNYDFYNPNEPYLFSPRNNTNLNQENQKMYNYNRQNYYYRNNYDRNNYDRNNYDRNNYDTNNHNRNNKKNSINNKLSNIKKNNIGKMINQEKIKNQNDIFADELKSLDMVSFDIKINQEKKNKLLKTISPKKNTIKNENINDKIIIDDYSDFDNIKSLNSMDNTLSDVVSIVDKN
jgi:hypothetical protein